MSNKKTKTILFTSALPAELKIIKQEIKKYSIIDVKIDFFSFGMGNYKTILNLTKKISEKKYDFVVNIGVCGYSNNPPLNKGELEGVKNRGDNIPLFIQIARIFNLANSKELLVPVFFKYSYLESIACSEKQIFEAKIIGEENFVDMESYGFELVMNDFIIPRLILKIPVDKIGTETKNFDYTLAKEKLEKSIDYKDLIEKISSYLDKIPKEDSLEEYENHYKMTFSEKYIFKKLYNKYNTFNNNSFSIFFEENKILKKKEFFKKLQNLLTKIQ